MTKRKREWNKWIKSLRAEAGFGPTKTYRDLEGRLHRDEGPAFISPNRVQWWNAGRLHGPSTDIYGSVTYYFRGVLIPKKYFTNPESLTIKEVLSNPNTEVRRVGLEVYGLDRFIKSKKAKIIHTDDDGQQLFHINISQRGDDIDTDPSAFIKVFNSTPEPDGTHKVFFIQVPPSVETVKEAVMWTFNTTDYHPQHET